jgi:hypothetical protein
MKQLHTKLFSQEPSVHKLIVSHYHTKIGKSLSQFTVSRQPAFTTQSLLNAMPENECNLACLDCASIMGTSNVCLPACVQADNVTTDSQLPFHLELNWVSTGSDMHATNNSKSSVACEITDCELNNI